MPVYEKWLSRCLLGTGKGKSVYTGKSWNVLHEDYNIFHCILVPDSKLLGWRNTCIHAHVHTRVHVCANTQLWPSLGSSGDLEIHLQPIIHRPHVLLQRENILNSHPYPEPLLAIILFFKQKHVGYD